MKVTRKANVIKVKAEATDSFDSSLVGRTVLKLTSDGNGWVAKFPSFSSSHPTRYLNIDYDELSYLLKAAEAMDEDEK